MFCAACGRPHAGECEKAHIIKAADAIKALVPPGYGMMWNEAKGYAKAALAASENDVLEQAARLCNDEAAACISDIVLGDDLGRREANARAGALLTAAADIRALKHKI